MKKFLILSVLVLFLGSLMALESDPSETVGFVKYELVAGDFNMVAVPMEITFPVAGATPMASDLATEIGNVSALIFWDTSISGWRTYTGNIVTDYSIGIGDALIVNALGTGTWNSSRGIRTMNSFQNFNSQKNRRK